MRILIAMMKHETNTFSPIVADWKRFQDWGAYLGEDALKAYEGTGMPFGAYVELAREAGAEIITPVAAEAMPSGPVTRDAYTQMAEPILEAVREGVDVALLDLHGAMVAEHTDDGEGTLLKKMREIDPDLPIAVTLDLHCNLTANMVENCTALIGYKTYPHVDMAETGAKAAQHLDRIMRTGLRPAKAFRQMSYLVPIPFQSTELSPGQALYESVAACEADGALSASLFMGFPAADIPDCGPVAVAYGETQEAADKAADKLAAAYEAAAPDFLKNEAFEPDAAVAEALIRAAKAGRGPVIIADTQDNPGAGGISATMGMLRALVKAGAKAAAIGLIVDPAAAAAAHRAGVGAEINVTLGGHASVAGDTPFQTAATVMHLSDGGLRATGPYYGGTELNLGPSACLRIAGVDVVVTSRIAQMADREMFRFVGVVPEEMDLLVVKSSTHFRADFAPIARDILVACAPGPMPLNPADLPFTRLRAGLRLSPDGPRFGADGAQAAPPDHGSVTAVAQ